MSPGRSRTESTTPFPCEQLSGQEARDDPSQGSIATKCPEFGGFVGFHLAWNISVEASCALGRCQRYPLYDVRSFSRQELVAPHELYLPYRPPPEVNPTKARDLSNKLRRNPTGEPNHVRVRQVAGRDVDEPFAARLGNAMVRHPSELPAKRVKSPVVRKYLREDGGWGEIESPHSKVETGL